MPFVLRGVRTEGNLSPDVLLMIDGAPQNDIHLANQRWFIAQIPLPSIERIEVIRGPYSTGYGTDAFSGVINIITKRYAQTERSQLRVRAGSFDTREGCWLQRIALADGALFAAEYRTTDGHEPFFATDRQSDLDTRFGTDASLAPGDVRTSSENYSALFDVGWRHGRARLRARGHDNAVAGIIGALDPSGAVSSRQYNAELPYRNDTHRDWDLAADLGYWRYRQKTEDVFALPPGTMVIFTDGVQDNPGYTEQPARLEASARFKGAYLPPSAPRCGHRARRSLRRRGDPQLPGRPGHGTARAASARAGRGPRGRVVVAGRIAHFLVRLCTRRMAVRARLDADRRVAL